MSEIALTCKNKRLQNCINLLLLYITVGEPLNYSLFRSFQSIASCEVSLASICIRKKKKNEKLVGVVNHVFDRKGSEFCDFDEQIFTRQLSWQKLIEIYQMFIKL